MNSVNMSWQVTIDRIRESNKRVTGCKSLKTMTKISLGFLSFNFLFKNIITYWSCSCDTMLAQHTRQNIKRYATEVVKATSLY